MTLVRKNDHQRVINQASGGFRPGPGGHRPSSFDPAPKFRGRQWFLQR